MSTHMTQVKCPTCGILVMTHIQNVVAICPPPCYAIFKNPKFKSPEAIEEQQKIEAVAIADRMRTAIRGLTLTPNQTEVITYIVLSDLRLVTHG